MKFNKKVATLILIVVVLVAVGAAYFHKQWLDSFQPTRPDASQTYTFRVSKDAELEGVVGNLEYYGFVQDKKSLLYALEHSTDTTNGSGDAITIGSNTIAKKAEYKLSQNMTAWQIAEILLNQGTHQDCNHGCPPGLFYPELLPGGDPAPTLKEQYEWVKTFEDCVEAKGQMSSEQYSERTGEPRHCVSPDGREFIQGLEGSRPFVGG